MCSSWWQEGSSIAGIFRPKQIDGKIGENVGQDHERDARLRGSAGLDLNVVAGDVEFSLARREDRDLCFQRNPLWIALSTAMKMTREGNFSMTFCAIFAHRRCECFSW